MPLCGDLPMPKPLAARGKFSGHGDPKLEFSVRKKEGERRKRKKREKRGSKIPASCHTTDLGSVITMTLVSFANTP